MLHFCTYFDINYIHRGLSLYHSLERHCTQFTLWILCFDDRTHEILASLGLSQARLIRRQEFEEGDKALIAAQKDRSKVEYYWTCTPILPLYLFRNYKEIESICYLDADIFFFSDPKPIYNELGDGSIFIVPHDYDENHYGYQYPAGRFNVGVLVFRRDAHSLSCLQWWRQRCLECCHLRPEEGKLGDQAYLDDWPERFKGVVVCNHIGINAGPWNIGKRTVYENGSHQVYLDQSPLVCYHFHKVRILTGRIAWVLGIPINHASAVLKLIYRPYLRELFGSELALQSFNVCLARQGIPWLKLAQALRQGRLPRYFLRA
jgi:hypothetical protein